MRSLSAFATFVFLFALAVSSVMASASQDGQLKTGDKSGSGSLAPKSIPPYIYAGATVAGAVGIYYLCPESASLYLSNMTESAISTLSNFCYQISEEFANLLVSRNNDPTNAELCEDATYGETLRYYHNNRLLVKWFGNQVFKQFPVPIDPCPENDEH